MSHPSPEGASEYRADYHEFQFGHLMSETVAAQYAINVETYNEANPFADAAARKIRLEELAANTNQELDAQRYFGRSVLVGQDAYIYTGGTVVLADILGATQDPVTGQFSSKGEHITLVGYYEGVTVLEEAIDETSLSRAQIYHRILAVNKGVQNAFVEQHTKVYAYVPIGDPIEVMRPPVSYLPNERWLKGAAGNLVNEEECDPEELEQAFQRIWGATRSKISRQKNIDWFLDQINEHTNLIGRYMELTTNGFIMQLGKHVRYLSGGNSVVQGLALGFCSVPTWEMTELNGSQVLAPNEDKPQLAIVLELEVDNGSKCLAKLPLRSIVEDEDEYDGESEI